MTFNDLETIKKIKLELSKIRPKLQLDGGDIKFINFKKGILKVRMLGECENCSLAHLTLEHAISATITRKIPAVKKVININLKVL